MGRRTNSVIIIAAISVILGLCGATQADMPGGLVAYWAFDDGSGTIARDSAGTNNGTIYNATWTTGKINSALNFDGSGDYVYVGDIAAIKTTAFTLSFWAQLNNPSGTNQGGIARGYIFGTNSDFSYKMDFTGGSLRAGLTNTSNTYYGGTVSIGNSSWHMWTLTAGSGSLYIYKDGVSAYSGTFSGSISYAKSQNEFVIGARKDGSYCMNGKIDDVRFYNRALSAAEVLTIYNNATYSGAIEGFETYTTDASLQNLWTINNSTITLENLLTHNSSTHSMRIAYNTSISPYRSEVSFNLGSQDWTQNNVRALVLYFHGYTNNAGQPMYVKLQDTALHSATIFYDYPEDLIQPAISTRWNEWNLNLQAFAAGGVQLTSIKQITVGIGSGTPGGSSGIVYIDDIGLYAQRCVAEYAPAGDFNGDCKVDINDILVLAEDWLLRGDGDITAATPNDTGLVAKYQFDETSGSTAADSSSNHYNATVNTAGLDNAWSSGGKYNNCLYFNGTYSTGAVVQIPNSVFNGITDQITFSVWINMDSSNPEQMTIFDCNGTLYNGMWPEAQWGQTIGFETSSEGTYWPEAEPQDYTGGWHHYAVVKYATSGIQRLYCDGELVAENTVPGTTWNNINNFIVGRSYTKDSRYGADVYKGKLDDLRIYNYALSHAEILNLAEVSQWHQQLLSRADGYKDASEQIDFTDFAALAQKWLQQQLWPNP